MVIAALVGSVVLGGVLSGLGVGDKDPQKPSVSTVPTPSVPETHDPTVPPSVEVTVTPTVSVTVTETATATATATKEEAPAAEEPEERSAAPEPPSEPTFSDVYYKNCDAARAAGAAPLYEGEPGYGPHLDRDGDGVACEPYLGR
ncbi:excalibur calcium-binding domain-containing protein [Streptomyces antibioticus]|uniref:excalibur calcium-binding domain-containing protein n=1 Tax=Streptomyces antibioticus TaxID=1890 RepID=UPI0036AA539A